MSPKDLKCSPPKINLPSQSCPLSPKVMVEAYRRDASSKDQLISELKASKKRLVAEVKDLKQELLRMEGEKKNAEQEQSRLQKEVERVQQQMNGLEAHLQSVQTERDQLDSQLQVCTSQFLRTQLLMPLLEMFHVLHIVRFSLFSLTRASWLQ